MNGVTKGVVVSMLFFDAAQRLVDMRKKQF